MKTSAAYPPCMSACQAGQGVGSVHAQPTARRLCRFFDSSPPAMGDLDLAGVETRDTECNTDHIDLLVLDRGICWHRLWFTPLFSFSRDIRSRTSAEDRIFQCVARFCPSPPRRPASAPRRAREGGRARSTHRRSTSLPPRWRRRPGGRAPSGSAFQDLHGVFQTGQNVVIDEVAGDPAHKEVATTEVEGISGATRESAQLKMPA